MLLVALLAARQRLTLSSHAVRYWIVTAVSIAIPNLLMFSVVPHLGAGFTGIMLTLSPVITMIFSFLFRVRRTTLLGVAGIVVGLVGAVIVTATRGEASQPAEPFWIAIALAIPVVVAGGNIYRTFDWPERAGSIELAAFSHLTAAVALLAGLLAKHGSHAFDALFALPLLVATQVATASVMFVFFFRLQSVGGPVYTSQSGYVAAAMSLLVGTIFLDESYNTLTWLGAVTIGVGVLMVTRAQSTRDRPDP